MDRLVIIFASIVLCAPDIGPTFYWAVVQMAQSLYGYKAEMRKIEALNDALQVEIDTLPAIKSLQVTLYNKSAVAVLKDEVSQLAADLQKLIDTVCPFESNPEIEAEMDEIWNAKVEKQAVFKRMSQQMVEVAIQRAKLASLHQEISETKSEAASNRREIDKAMAEVRALRAEDVEDLKKVESTEKELVDMSEWPLPPTRKEWNKASGRGRGKKEGEVNAEVLGKTVFC